MSGTGARVGIVGGGVLGLTLAHRLAAAGHRPTVLEAAPDVGGLAGWHDVGGYAWDQFYHVILLSDRALRGLLEELGLGDRLRWGYTRTGFYSDGAFHSLSSTLDFARFPLLGLADKARLAATILRASRYRDWRGLEGETSAEWLRRWSGRRTYERLWAPLLRSKLGEHASEVSAVFIWAIIARMYSARRSGLKREMFGYVEGGYATVLRRFRDALTGAGVEIQCRAPVAEVTGNAAGARARLAGGGERAFDAVVLTVPTGRVSRLAPQLTPAEHARLQAVRYQGVVCPSLLLRRPLHGYYVTNITDPWVPFTAVIEMTALVDRERFGGHSLVYLPRYAGPDDPIWAEPDDAVVARGVEALGRMYPGLGPSDVVASRVARARDVLALATLDYSTRLMPPTETSVPNLFVANSAQIVAGTLNLNETVGLADEAARRLLPQLRRHAPAGGRLAAAAAG